VADSDWFHLNSPQKLQARAASRTCRIRGTTKSTDTFLSQPTLSYSSRLTHK
jgi:hypothetical protein